KGFARAVRQEFAVDLRDLQVMILGGGGAGRAIALQCARENCERLVITNRTFATAQKLAEEVREYFTGPKVLGPVPRLQSIPWEEAAIRFQVAHLDLIVNATPLGLNRSDPSPIPARLLAPHLMIYDTVYGEGRTPFVSAAIEAGARAAPAHPPATEPSSIPRKPPAVLPPGVTTILINSSGDFLLVIIISVAPSAVWAASCRDACLFSPIFSPPRASASIIA